MADTPELRDSAAKASRLAAIIVMAVVIVAFAVGHFLEAHDGSKLETTTTTTVVTDPSTTKLTEETDQTGATAIDSDKTVTTESPATKQTTTVEEASEDERHEWFGLTTGNPAGGYVIELFIAGLAGFLAGAITQRIFLARYGIKIGGLEIAEVPPISNAAADAASKVPNEITAEDLRHLELAGPGYSEWWMIPPPPGEDLRLSLITQRIQLEAGVRQLAFHRGIEFQPPLVTLVALMVDREIFSVAFGQSVRRLLALGDRLIAGATVAAGADISMRAGYTKLQRTLAVLLNRER